MKRKFFAGLLCLYSSFGFSQPGTPAIVASNSNVDQLSIPEPALVVSNTDMVVAHGRSQSTDPQMSSIEQGSSEEQIRVYPNPMGECIFVETGFITEGTMQCILYNAAGKEMMNMHFNVQPGVARRIISAGKLDAGTYFLHTMYNGGDISSGTIFTIKKK